MPEERRKYIRINKTFSLSYHKVNDFLRSGSRNKNISEGGICLPLSQHFSVDSLLEIEIHSDELKVPVKALTRIAWIISLTNGRFPYEAGLEFLEISPEQRQMLRNYIINYAAQDGHHDVRWID